MSQTRQQLFVYSITYEAVDILRIELRAVPSGALAAFTPGAHINLHFGEGLSRSYSLINDPAMQGRYEIAVQREAAGRGGSAWIHDRLRVGERVEASLPVNAFPLSETATHSVLIAGGIGITPIRAMIRCLEALGRSWELHYRARSRARAAFLAELSAPEFAGKVHLSFSDETPRESCDIAAIIAAAPDEAEIYCCGPLDMIAAFEAATSGLDPARLHTERFQGEEVTASGGFTVRAVKSNVEVEVREGQTILQALREAGLDPDYSCESGLCGECLTRVIAGEPDHKDYFLTETEKKSGEVIMICCSGSRSPILELDL